MPAACRLLGGDVVDVPQLDTSCAATPVAAAQQGKTPCTALDMSLQTSFDWEGARAGSNPTCYVGTP
jgi:hypothetical protein